MAKKKATRKKAGTKKPASGSSSGKNPATGGKKPAIPPAKKAGKRAYTRGDKPIGRPRNSAAKNAAKKVQNLAERRDRAAKIKTIAETVAGNAAAREAAVSSDLKRVKSKGGRKPFVPTENDRATVELAVGLGLRRDEICLFVTNPATGRPISEPTLEDHFADELVRGLPMLAMKIGASFVKKATSNHPQAITAGIWLSKCRLGWRERSVVEVEVKSGVLVVSPEKTPQEWIEQASIRSAGKHEPGSEDDQ